MALGRRAWGKSKARPYPRARTVNFVTEVKRHAGGGFVAVACLKTRRGPIKSCGIHAQARSPQSAVAKAVMSLARHMASRGRKFYTKSDVATERRDKFSRKWFEKQRKAKRTMNYPQKRSR